MNVKQNKGTVSCKRGFFFFKIFFLMWTIFKVFIEFVTILLLFYVFSFFGCEACGILAPQPGMEPAPSHWEAKSEPLDHQGSPRRGFFRKGVG